MTMIRQNDSKLTLKRNGKRYNVLYGDMIIAETKTKKINTKLSMLNKTFNNNTPLFILNGFLNG